MIGDVVQSDVADDVRDVVVNVHFFTINILAEF